MTLEGIRAAHRAKPFLPFTIHTSSGESYTVVHPELCSFSPVTQLVIIQTASGEVGLIDFESVSEITFTRTKRPATAE